MSKYEAIVVFSVKNGDDVSALVEKIKSIKASAHPAAQQVAESESRIAALKVQKRELLEAINAGKTALHTVNEVLETLDNAEGWSTWDVMGGGLMADLAKYEELDDAQEQIEQLQVELRRFKTELSDVEITADLQVTLKPEMVSMMTTKKVVGRSCGRVMCQNCCQRFAPSSSTASPRGPVTIDVTARPCVAAIIASTVPSPPSATGTETNCASGKISRNPFSIACATSVAERLSL